MAEKSNNGRLGTGVPFVVKRWRVPKKYNQEASAEIKEILKKYRTKYRSEN